MNAPAPHRALPSGEPRHSRQAGFGALFALLFTVLLFVSVYGVIHFQQKNLHASADVLTRSKMLKYAESAAQLAMHDFQHQISPNPGFIGADGWTVANDVGVDGIAGNGDPGEGDGYPDYGEPGVGDVPMGDFFVRSAVWPQGSGAYLVHTVCWDNENYWYVYDRFVQQSVPAVPKEGPVFLTPNQTYNLQTNSTIDGQDHTRDGFQVGAGPRNIFTTHVADVSTISSALSGNIANFVLPNGSSGLHVGPVASFDASAFFDDMLALAETTLTTGTHESGSSLGTNTQSVYHCSGNLTLGRTFSGAGAILVDGNLTMKEGAEFRGLVMVKGDITMMENATDGPATIKGAVAFADATTTDLKLESNCRVLYSSEALDDLQAHLMGTFDTVYIEKRFTDAAHSPPP